MAITWALLDPIMTIVRPLAALFTATVAGVLVNALPGKGRKEIPPQQHKNLALQPEGSSFAATMPVVSESHTGNSSFPEAVETISEIAPGGT
jgi:uncharacterized membrane protein YraQ (UPF0718 family)